jgi:hypothetical protein
MPVIGGTTAKLVANDAELAKRAPQPRKLEMKAASKSVQKGLRYDGGRTNSPTQQPSPQLYDYEAVRSLLDIESIFAKACWKYVEQIWSRSWEFRSKSPKASNYIRARYKQIAYVSGVSTFDLFNDMAIQAVVYSNAYIQKIRKRDSSGGQIRTIGGRRIEPIASYVVLDTPSVKTVRNEYGVPLKYIQDLRGRRNAVSTYNVGAPDYIEIDPQDMIHITFHRQAGFSEGTPMVIPVIDDIAGLRRMEETAEIISFQASIPVMHFKVGSEEPGAGGTVAEVEDLEYRVNNMLAHGALITNERCTIDIQQATSDITSILEFIAYYKNRVLAGLGIASVLMGDSNTSNRDTSLVVANEMQQTTRMFQRVLAEAINTQMVDEMLLEGGVDIFDDKYEVTIYIPEIDAASERANQVHGLSLYEGGGITEAYLRHNYLGLDPVEDDERKDMFLDRIAIPKIEAQGHAKGLGDPLTAGPAEKKIRSITDPQNQFGKTPRPSKIAKRDALLADIRNIITSVPPDAGVWFSSIKAKLPAEMPEDSKSRILTTLMSNAIILRNTQLNDIRTMSYDDIMANIDLYIPDLEEDNG